MGLSGTHRTPYHPSVYPHRAELLFTHCHDIPCKWNPEFVVGSGEQLIFYFTECSSCIGDITAAALECLDLIHFDQVQCMWDLIEADFQCIICFCEVIEEVGAIFGQEWSCDDWTCLLC